MLRFKLILIDASGATRTATIEADSQAEAVDLARRKGYHVRHIEPIYDLDGESEPPAPVETAEHGFPTRRIPPRESRTQAASTSSRSQLPVSFEVLLTMALAGLALLVALGTLAYVLIRGSDRTASTESRPDPLGTSLAAYDFSTASRAMESEARIEAKLDLRASLELERKTRGLRTQEKADTLKVHREADFSGGKIVFYSYKERGEVKHRTQGFEKHEESGFWIRKSISPGNVQGENPQLARQMQDWELYGPAKPKETGSGKKPLP